MIKVRGLAGVWNCNLCSRFCDQFHVCLVFICGHFGHISSKHASRNNFKALCDCVVGIDTGMASLSGALNPDIHVPLGGDLPRSRKVNVTLDEEAVQVERINFYSLRR